MNKIVEHTTLLSRKGTVNFYDLDRGYGSIRDHLTRQNYIVYGNNLIHPVMATDCVSFEIEKTTRGLVAKSVKLIRNKEHVHQLI